MSAEDRTEAPRGSDGHSEATPPALTLLGAITVGLAEYRRQVSEEGWCADGPDCLWCPAEVIRETIRSRTKVDPNL
jgi:hypothetical protein